MIDREAAVAEFHKAFGVPTEPPADSLELEKLCDLRARLIKEEVGEVMVELDDYAFLASACGYRLVPGSEVEGVRARLLKELCDLQVVLSGTAVALGLPLDKAFARVHESNMSKVGPDGQPIYREDGKVLKGPNYKPPDLSDLV